MLFYSKLSALFKREITREETAMERSKRMLLLAKEMYKDADENFPGEFHFAIFYCYLLYNVLLKTLA